MKHSTCGSLWHAERADNSALPNSRPEQINKHRAQVTANHRQLAITTRPMGSMCARELPPASMVPGAAR